MGYTHSMDLEPIRIKTNEGLSAYKPVETGIDAFPKIYFRKEYFDPNETTMRVYRGITSLSSEIIDNQMCYAGRIDTSPGEVRIGNKIEPLAETLANEPVYDNLTRYIEERVKSVNFKQSEKLSQQLWEIEDEVLKGRSVREILTFNQILHPGGLSTDIGIEPYLSASTILEDAMRWTNQNGGVLVMDIPLSRIETAKKELVGEVAVKFSINPNEIKAIIPTNLIHEKIMSDDLEKIHQIIDQNLGNQSKESMGLWQQQEKVKKQIDMEAWKHDVEKIKARRVGYLMRKFPEVSIDSNDNYELVKQKIKDNLTERIKLFGGSPEVYELSKQELGKPEEFILLEYKKMIENIEERKLPEIATILGISTYSSPEEILIKRNDVLNEAEQRGITIDRENYSRNQLRKIVTQLK